MKGAEDQKTVSKWAEETFGPVGSNMMTAARANKEMAELVMKLALDDNAPGAAEEIADVVIVLLRLIDRLGKDLDDEVDAKMRINRAREWVLDGHGQGQHKQGTWKSELATLKDAAVRELQVRAVVSELASVANEAPLPGDRVLAERIVDSMAKVGPTQLKTKSANYDRLYAAAKRVRDLHLAVHSRLMPDDRTELREFSDLVDELTHKPG